MSLIRRDNPLLPDEYYVCSFVAGLQHYIQNHLQCHRPRNMIEAIWMARRIEQSHPFNSRIYNSFNRGENTNPRDKGRASTNAGTKTYRYDKEAKSRGTGQSNKRGRDYGKYRKCHESWLLGHKCKPSEKQLFTITQGHQEEDEETEGKEIA